MDDRLHKVATVAIAVLDAAANEGMADDDDMTTLIQFADEQGVEVPAWLREFARGCRATRVKAAQQSGRCRCGGEMELHSAHERDSSNDWYACGKCGWQYFEVETWAPGGPAKEGVG